MGCPLIFNYDASTASANINDFLISTTVPFLELRTTATKAFRKVALPSRVVPHYPLMVQELQDMAISPGDNSVGPTEEEILARTDWTVVSPPRS